MRDKRQKFIDLAEKRVNAVLKQIELIGNLSNRQNYEYIESDYKEIFRAIDAEVRKMKQKFVDSPSGNAKRFTLRE